MPESTGNIPSKLYPGIIMPMIEDFLDMSTDTDIVNKSFNLSLDRKKINANKYDKLGGIDLSGFEKSTTKEEVESRLEEELKIVNKVDNIFICKRRGF